MPTYRRWLRIRWPAVLVATLGLLLTACGPVGGSGPQSGQLAADQTFRFPINNDIGTFDPAQLNAEVDAEFAINLFNGLLKFDNRYNIVPDIAERMPDLSADGLTYTFKLRNDVKFSNGDPVAAKDFIYSWDRAAAAQGPYASNLSRIVGYEEVTARNAAVKHLGGLRAPDDYTFVVQLSQPTGYFLTEVAAYTLTTAVVDQKVVDKEPDTWWTKPETLIGTGPFKMVARTPKQSLDFEAVENWWGTPKPTLKKVHVILVLLLGRGLDKIILAIAITRWMDMARLVRGQTLALREREFVLAAVAIGTKPKGIILRHILPNALGPIIVQATFGVPAAILFEGFLSFFGIGHPAADAVLGIDGGRRLPGHPPRAPHRHGARARPLADPHGVQLPW
jgi:extracellular solute-binding protein (family 5)/binding-protein-dependent transport system inner membrane component